VGICHSSVCSRATVLCMGVGVNVYVCVGVGVGVGVGVCVGVCVCVCLCLSVVDICCTCEREMTQGSYWSCPVLGLVLGCAYLVPPAFLGAFLD
jgi:hypothetical protein